MPTVIGALSIAEKAHDEADLLMVTSLASDKHKTKSQCDPGRCLAINKQR